MANVLTSQVRWPWGWPLFWIILGDFDILASRDMRFWNFWKVPNRRWRKHLNHRASSDILSSLAFSSEVPQWSFANLQGGHGLTWSQTESLQTGRAKGPSGFCCERTPLTVPLMPHFPPWWRNRQGKKRNNIPAHDSLMFSALVNFYCWASPLSRKPLGLGSVGWKKGKGWGKLWLRRSWSLYQMLFAQGIKEKGTS